VQRRATEFASERIYYYSAATKPIPTPNGDYDLY